MSLKRIDRVRLWHRFLVICGLSAASVAAPLLDLYGKSPEVFVANGSSAGQIVLFSLLVSLTIPLLALVLLAAADKVGPRTSNIVYLFLLIPTAVATGLVISRQLVADSSVGASVLALGIAALILGLYRWLKIGLRVFALLLPVAFFLFLAFSATSRLIWIQPEVTVPEVSDIGNPAPIVFIQLDEFPISSIIALDGTINERLFPNFGRLADSGTWYRNALSASIATTQSVPATMEGRLGEQGLSPTAIDHPNNLFALLGSDYEMHVIEWVADLCPENICPDYAGLAPNPLTSLLQDVGVVYGHLSLPKAIRDDLPSIDNSWTGFVGQQASSPSDPVAVDDHPVPEGGDRSRWIDWIQRILNGLTEDAPPTLSYAHLDAPHVPWQVNPSGTHYKRPEQYTEVDGVQGDGRWALDADVARLGFQRHLYQLGFLDQMLGSLFERMDETGNWDAALIVVVADHGASFVPGEHRRWPYENNRDDLYRVPLFVKYPGQVVGEIRDEPAFTIDILPAIVDVLGIRTDWAFDGQSLLDIAGTDRPHEIVYWCCNTDGVSTDLSVLFAQVERNHEWVPYQDSWLGIAAVGPHGDLVGTATSELSVESDEDVRWSLDHAGALASVDRQSGRVQTLITGRLELPNSIVADTLLIAVNGQVAGTGFLSRDAPTSGRIRALIAEELLMDGDNDVTILVPLPGGGWLTGVADDIALEYLADDGHALELKREGNRRIQVDPVSEIESGWTVSGWAADIGEKVTPDRIYVFAGDVLIAFGPPTVDMTDVVRWHDSEDLLRSGFSFDVDLETVPIGVEWLTVVAEFDDYAVGDEVSLAG